MRCAVAIVLAGGTDMDGLIDWVWVGYVWLDCVVLVQSVVGAGVLFACITLPPLWIAVQVRNDGPGCCLARPVVSRLTGVTLGCFFESGFSGLNGFTGL